MARARGRIHFAKNPWPKGHRIVEAAWSGRLDDRGLWFDLHVQTASYDEGDRSEDDDEDEELDDDWRSKIVWTNYGRCTISSTKWDHPGFLVGTADAPFDWAKLRKRTFRVDRDAMGIYLLGHDSIGHHAIRFAANRIDWDARIALTYGGDRPFRHRMRARVDGVRFAGFRPADGLPADVADDLLQVFAVDARRYRLRGGAYVPG